MLFVCETMAVEQLMGMEGWRPFSVLMVYRSPSAHAAWVAMGPIRLEDRFHKYSTTGKLLASEMFHLSVSSFSFLFWVLTSSCGWRSEYDGDLQSQLLSKANEEDKNCSRALSVVNAVVRAAKDLLHRAFAVDGKDKHLTFLLKVHL